jgi:hypothetical protein
MLRDVSEHRIRAPTWECPDYSKSGYWGEHSQASLTNHVLAHHAVIKPQSKEKNLDLFYPAIIEAAYHWLQHLIPRSHD